MKIAFIITGLGMGGAETQISSLADHLADLGNQILLISLCGDVVTSPQNKAIKVVSLRVKKDPISFLKAYYRSRNLLVKFSPDVIHSHMVHANIFSRLLRISMYMNRLICSSHSSYEGGVVRTWAYRVTDALADMNTNVSHDAVKSSIRSGQVLSHKIIAVHNGIDCQRFRNESEKRIFIRKKLNVSDDECVLIAVGRFAEAKDYPNLLRAFSFLCARRTNVLLWIVGAGDKQSQFEAMAHELGIYHRVNFLGLRRDVPDLMNAADVFVLSSAWEGFGLVVAEAMACERVVVATDCGGVREVLGKEGFLTEKGDSTALANSLIEAVNLTAPERFTIGRDARKRVLQNYSLNASANKWMKIYNGQYYNI